MRKLILIVIVASPLMSLSQNLNNLDFIAPYHDNLAAVQRDGEWGFINANGELVVDFRKDLVLSKFEDGSYPVFNDDRALIKQKKNGIAYYGFIDTTGKTRIEPQYRNATQFVNGEAIALKVIKETLGSNEPLGKNVVNYKYFEVVIDTNNEVKDYLNPEGVNVVLNKDFIKDHYKISSKRLSDNLYAVRGKDKKWTVYKVQ